MFENAEKIRKMNTRFNPDCKTFEEAREYFQNRGLQLLKYGYRTIHIGWTDYGAVGIFQYKNGNGEVFKTPYVFPKYRHDHRFLQECHKINYYGFRVLTHMDCGLVNYLRKNNINFTYPIIPESDAYRVIEHYYDNKKAKRSGIYYMNHIDEGLALFSAWFSENSIKDAYCLHPIYQDNIDAVTKLSFMSDAYSKEITKLAHDYAIAANSYLPKKGSPQDVPTLNYKLKTMLIADKIQNRKDFELYNQNHPNYKDLALYFRRWFDILDISEKEYEKWKNYLIRGWLC